MDDIQGKMMFDPDSKAEEILTQLELQLDISFWGDKRNLALQIILDVLLDDNNGN